MAAGSASNAAAARPTSPGPAAESCSGVKVTGGGALPPATPAISAGGRSIKSFARRNHAGSAISRGFTAATASAVGTSIPAVS